MLKILQSFFFVYILKNKIKSKNWLPILSYFHLWKFHV